VLSGKERRQYDRITTHFDSFSVVRILTVAFFMLLLQAIMEETTSRAFPMRLWAQRSLAFRMIVPSAFFVAIHLVSEQFSLERIGVLFMVGIFKASLTHSQETSGSPQDCMRERTLPDTQSAGCGTPGLSWPSSVSLRFRTGQQV
jgi:hypothetical protein